MAKSPSEAIGFVQHITTGKSLVHLEAILGYGKVPEPSDFTSTQPESLERAAEFLALIDEYTSCLGALTEEASKRAAEKNREEKAQYLPGLAPGDEETQVNVASRPASKPGVRSRKAAR